MKAIFLTRSAERVGNVGPRENRLPLAVVR